MKTKAKSMRIPPKDDMMHRWGNSTLRMDSGGAYSWDSATGPRNAFGGTAAGTAPIDISGVPNTTTGAAAGVPPTTPPAADPAAAAMAKAAHTERSLAAAAMSPKFGLPGLTPMPAGLQLRDGGEYQMASGGDRATDHWLFNPRPTLPAQSPLPSPLPPQSPIPDWYRWSGHADAGTNTLRMADGGEIEDRALITPGYTRVKNGVEYVPRTLRSMSYDAEAGRGFVNPAPVRMADGGIPSWMPNIFKSGNQRFAEFQAAQGAPQAAPPPVPVPVAPAPQTAAPLVRGFVDPKNALQAREQAAGLHTGGYVNGMGGRVPGEPTGDRHKALYEGGEFVVSNAMLKKAPGLREELHALREETLEGQGKTVAEADAEQVKGGRLRAQSGGLPPLPDLDLRNVGPQPLPASTVAMDKIAAQRAAALQPPPSALQSGAGMAPPQMRAGALPQEQVRVFENAQRAAAAARMASTPPPGLRLPSNASPFVGPPAPPAPPAPPSSTNPFVGPPTPPPTAPSSTNPFVGPPPPGGPLGGDARGSRMNFAGAPLEKAPTPMPPTSATGKAGALFNRIAPDFRGLRDMGNAAVASGMKFAGPAAVAVGAVPGQLNVAEVASDPTSSKMDVAKQQFHEAKRVASGATGTAIGYGLGAAAAVPTAAIPVVGPAIAPFLPAAGGAAGGYLGLKFNDAFDTPSPQQLRNTPYEGKGGSGQSSAAFAAVDPRRTGYGGRGEGFDDPRRLDRDPSRQSLGDSRDFSGELNKVPKDLPAGLREGVVFKTIDPKTGRVTYSGRNVGVNANGETQMVNGRGETIKMLNGRNDGKGYGFVQNVDPTTGKPTGGSVLAAPGGVNVGTDGPSSIGGSAPNRIQSALRNAAMSGDTELVRKYYADKGETFNGTTPEAYKAEQSAREDQELQRLAASPLGTPGRTNAMQRLTNNQNNATLRRGQDIEYQRAMAPLQMTMRRLQYQSDLMKHFTDPKTGQPDRERVALELEKAGLEPEATAIRAGLTSDQARDTARETAVQGKEDAVRKHFADILGKPNKDTGVMEADPFAGAEAYRQMIRAYPNFSTLGAKERATAMAEAETMARLTAASRANQNKGLLTRMGVLPADLPHAPLDAPTLRNGEIEKRGFFAGHLFGGQHHGDPLLTQGDNTPERNFRGANEEDIRWLKEQKKGLRN